jgi:glyoxylase-like metal-dependent hydrolase (beta-lactamase superfamily II)
MSLKIANSWFERKTIDDQITLLWEPYVHDWLRCNIWHVKGRERDLLIDTGMGISSLRAAAADIFKKPLSVVITHTHLDHMGSAYEFDHCLCHPSEAAKLSSAADGLPLRWSDWPEDVFKSMEIDHDPGEYVISALPHAGFEIDNFKMQAATPAALLNEGDRVDIGNRNFEVLHLPGHSPGSIALWEEGNGTLFSGDVIYDGPLLDKLDGSDIRQYVRSMERILTLPVKVVHGGHEPSFDGERMREIARAYLSQHQ